MFWFNIHGCHYASHLLLYTFFVHVLDIMKNIRNVVEDFGCCYNNFVLPFEETDGINARYGVGRGVCT